MFSRVLRTVIRGNRLEFASLQELEDVSATLVYFAHPFSSWEKGTNERHNGLLTRNLPSNTGIVQLDIAIWENIKMYRLIDLRYPKKVEVKRTEKGAK